MGATRIVPGSNRDDNPGASHEGNAGALEDPDPDYSGRESRCACTVHIATKTDTSILLLKQRQKGGVYIRFKLTRVSVVFSGAAPYLRNSRPVRCITIESDGLFATLFMLTVYEKEKLGFYADKLNTGSGLRN